MSDRLTVNERARLARAVGNAERTQEVLNQNPNIPSDTANQMIDTANQALSRAAASTNAGLNARGAEIQVITSATINAPTLSTVSSPLAPVPPPPSVPQPPPPMSAATLAQITPIPPPEVAPPPQVVTPPSLTTPNPGLPNPQSPQDPRPSPNPTASAGSTAGATGAAPPAAGPAQTGLTAAAPDITFNFEPNPHNQYDRVTYKFRLSIINDKDAEDITVGDKLRDNSIRKIIIAESGVTTGFNITDVEINDSVSANFRHRGNMTTEIKFTLIEPYSLTLPDKIYSASMMLGVPNWRLAPLFLELEFKYIKSDGSFYAPPPGGNLVKIYQLEIIDFDSQVTEVGTTYQVVSQTKNNRGFSDHYNILPISSRITTGQGGATPTTISIPAANSVKEFFTELSRVVTELYVTTRNNNPRAATPIIVYKFEVTPDLGSQTINFLSQNNNRRSSFSQNSPGGEITISRGISVSGLVDDVMSGLQDPNFFVPHDRPDGAVRIPRIECRTKNIGWDELLNDYVREITFVISTKESIRPVPTREYGVAYQSNPELQKERLKWIAEYMKKSYDYYYTGLNTEVLGVDIKFNQLHAITFPLMTSVPLPQYSNAAVITGLAREFRETAAAIDQAQQNIRQLENTPEGVGESVTNVMRQITQEEAAITTANSRLLTIRQESIVLFDESSTVRTALGLPAESSSRETAVRERAAQIEANNARAAQRKLFLEDAPKRTPENLLADSLRLTYNTDFTDRTNSVARGGPPSETPNPQDSTRAMVTSILTQIYDRPGNNMLEIDMQIKGDPYWLGASDVERMVELTKFIDGGASSNQVADSRQTTVEFFNRDALLLLKFRAGTPPDAVTGFQNLNNESDFFYGIYTVIQITHEFKNGNFTQRLKADRDTLVNVSTLRQAEVRVRNATQPPVATSTSNNAATNGETAQSAAAPDANTGSSTTRSIQENSGDPNSPGVSWNNPAADAARERLGASTFQTREGGIAAADARIAEVTNEGGLREPSQTNNRSVSLPPTNPASDNPALIQNPEYAAVYSRLHGEAFSRADGSNVAQTLREQYPALAQEERARASLLEANSVRAQYGLPPVPRGR